MAYDLGDPVSLAVSVRDSTGALANATAVTCTVTLPDGSTSTPTVTNATTGAYSATYTPASAGRFTVRWVATGSNASAFTDTFDVRDGSTTGLVSVSDLKAYLNITSTTNDEELRRFIMSASDLAERVTGRTFRRLTFTETLPGLDKCLLLPSFPVISITSVVEDDATIGASGYVADLRSGVLTRGTRRLPIPWGETVVVTYVAGETNPPATAYELVLELARHMWRTQRGAQPSPPGMSGGDDYVPGAAYAMTYRARELADALRVPSAS